MMMTKAIADSNKQKNVLFERGVADGFKHSGLSSLELHIESNKGTLYYLQE